jgi:ankyrin repeat protein
MSAQRTAASWQLTPGRKCAFTLFRAACMARDPEAFTGMAVSEKNAMVSEMWQEAKDTNPGVIEEFNRLAAEEGELLDQTMRPYEARVQHAEREEEEEQAEAEVEMAEAVAARPAARGPRAAALPEQLSRWRQRRRAHSWGKTAAEEVEEEDEDGGGEWIPPAYFLAAAVPQTEGASVRCSSRKRRCPVATEPSVSKSGSLHPSLCAPTHFKAQPRLTHIVQKQTLRRLARQAGMKVVRLTSNYRGVQYNGGKWRSTIKHKKRVHHLGTFANEIDAARAFDVRARQLRGATARCNFPEVADEHTRLQHAEREEEAEEGEEQAERPDDQPSSAAASADPRKRGRQADADPPDSSEWKPKEQHASDAAAASDSSTVDHVTSAGQTLKQTPKVRPPVIIWRSDFTAEELKRWHEHQAALKDWYPLQSAVTATKTQQKSVKYAEAEVETQLRPCLACMGRHRPHTCALAATRRRGHGWRKTAAEEVEEEDEDGGGEWIPPAYFLAAAVPQSEGASVRRSSRKRRCPVATEPSVSKSGSLHPSLCAPTHFKAQSRLTDAGKRQALRRLARKAGVGRHNLCLQSEETSDIQNWHRAKRQRQGEKEEEEKEGERGGERVQSAPLSAATVPQGTSDNGTSAILASRSLGCTLDMELPASSAPLRSSPSSSAAAALGGNPRNLSEIKASARRAKAAAAVAVAARLGLEGEVIEENKTAAEEAEEEDEYAMHMVQAAVQGDAAQLSVFVDAKVLDINATSDESPRRNALMECAKNGHLSCLKTMLRYKADIAATDEDKMTAFHYACAGGHTDCVKVLVKAKSSISETNLAGETGFSLAKQAGHDEVLYVFEEEMIQAAAKGRLKLMKAYLTIGVEVNATIKTGRTALIEAARRTKMTCIIELLAREADHEITDSSGMTALMHAAQGWGPGRNGRSTDCVQLLLDSGSDVNKSDPSGMTPFLFACAKGHSGCIEALLSAGADAVAKTLDGETGFILASGHPAVLSQLKRKADIADETIKEKGAIGGAIMEQEQHQRHTALTNRIGDNVDSNVSDNSLYQQVEPETQAVDNGGNRSSDDEACDSVISAILASRWQTPEDKWPVSVELRRKELVRRCRLVGVSCHGRKEMLVTRLELWKSEQSGMLRQKPEDMQNEEPLPVSVELEKKELLRRCRVVNCNAGDRPVIDAGRNVKRKTKMVRTAILSEAQAKARRAFRRLARQAGVASHDLCLQSEETSQEDGANDGAIMEQEHQQRHTALTDTIDDSANSDVSDNFGVNESETPIQMRLDHIVSSSPRAGLAASQQPEILPKTCKHSTTMILSEQRAVLPRLRVLRLPQLRCHAYSVTAEKPDPKDAEIIGLRRQVEQLQEQLHTLTAASKSEAGDVNDDDERRKRRRQQSFDTSQPTAAMSNASDKRSTSTADEVTQPGPSAVVTPAGENEISRQPPKDAARPQKQVKRVTTSKHTPTTQVATKPAAAAAAPAAPAPAPAAAPPSSLQQDTAKTTPMVLATPNGNTDSGMQTQCKNKRVNLLVDEDTDESVVGELLISSPISCDPATKATSSSEMGGDTRLPDMCYCLPYPSIVDLPPPYGPRTALQPLSCGKGLSNMEAAQKMMLVQIGQPEQQRQSLRLGKAIRFIDKIKATFGHDIAIHKAFVQLLQPYFPSGFTSHNTICALHARISKLFEGTPDLIIEFETFIPAGCIDRCRQHTGTVLADPIDDTSSKVSDSSESKTQRPQSPSLHKDGSKGGRASKSAPAANSEESTSAAEVREMLMRGSSSVNYGKALQFIQKINAKCGNDIHKRFMQILQLNWSGSPSDSDIYVVHAQISKLFEATPDLMVEFETFMPADCVNRCRQHTGTTVTEPPIANSAEPTLSDSFETGTSVDTNTHRHGERVTSRKAELEDGAERDALYQQVEPETQAVGNGGNRSSDDEASNSEEKLRSLAAAEDETGDANVDDGASHTIPHPTTAITTTAVDKESTSAAEARGSSSVNYGKALQFIQKINAKCGNDINKRFMQILQLNWSGSPSDSDIYVVHAQISKLFEATPDLMVEFETFIPADCVNRCRQHTEELVCHVDGPVCKQIASDSRNLYAQLSTSAVGARRTQQRRRINSSSLTCEDMPRRRTPTARSGKYQQRQQRMRAAAASEFSNGEHGARAKKKAKTHPHVMSSRQTLSGASVPSNERVMRSTFENTQFKLNSRVRVRFVKPKGYFPGRITEVLGNGKFRVHFDDDEIFAVSEYSDDIQLLEDEAFVDDETHMVTPVSSLQCAVCFESLSTLAPDRQVYKLPCNHSFCDECIESWCSEPSRPGRPTCPVCRRAFVSLRHCPRSLACELHSLAKPDISGQTSSKGTGTILS